MEGQEVQQVTYFKYLTIGIDLFKTMSSKTGRRLTFLFSAALKVKCVGFKGIKGQKWNMQFVIMFSLVYNHLNDCVFVRRSRSSMVSATLLIYRKECHTLRSFVESSGNTQNVLDHLASISVNKNAGAKSLSVCVR